LEGIKGFSMTKEALIKRYTFTNSTIFNSYFAENKSVILLGTHYNNWEWGTLASGHQLQHELHILYKPLSNQYIDTFLKKIRSGHNVTMSNIQDPLKINEGNAKIYVFISDQNPQSLRHAHITTFLNQKTAFLMGAEFYAQRYNLPVFFFDVQRYKKGYYNITFSVLHNEIMDKKNYIKGEIIEKYKDKLTQQIERNPALWLWSHKRWKHNLIT